jgi:hypothetical protein
MSVLGTGEEIVDEEAGGVRVTQPFHYGDTENTEKAMKKKAVKSRPDDNFRKLFFLSCVFSVSPW